MKLDVHPTHTLDDRRVERQLSVRRRDQQRGQQN